MAERQKKPNPSNPWYAFWADLIGQEVKVSYYIAGVMFVKKGTVLLFNANKDSIVLKTLDGHKLYIRTPITIEVQKK